MSKLISPYGMSTVGARSSAQTILPPRLPGSDAAALDATGDGVAAVVVPAGAAPVVPTGAADDALAAVAIGSGALVAEIAAGAEGAAPPAIAAGGDGAAAVVGFAAGVFV